MRLIYITEPSGRNIYINPRHIISVFQGDGTTTVKVSDGKTYNATEKLSTITSMLELCS